MIDRFTGEYEFLSNFYRSPLAIGEYNYLTAEHAFQATKANDPEQRRAISMAQSPGQAKKLGRKVDLREDWEIVKVEVMRQILLIKFGDAELREKLLATGDEQLVEGNTWHDNYWGSCTCKDCGNRGKNMLGKLLMQIRTELRYQGEWHDAMVDMFDRLGSESWPVVNLSPKELSNALYDHVNWLCDYTAGGALHRVKAFLTAGKPSRKEVLEFLEAEIAKREER